MVSGAEQRDREEPRLPNWVANLEGCMELYTSNLARCYRRASHWARADKMQGFRLGMILTALFATK